MKRRPSHLPSIALVLSLCSLQGACDSSNTSSGGQDESDGKAASSSSGGAGSSSGNGAGGGSDTNASGASTNGGPNGDGGVASGGGANGGSGSSESSGGTAGMGLGGEGNGGNVGSETGGRGSDSEVGIFVAVGHQGRSIISCDLGKTWINNRSYDTDGGAESCEETTPVRCWDSGCTYLDGETCKTADECDCDHHPGRAMGVAGGGGKFVAVWGWGPPGAAKTTSDGVDWKVGDESVSGKTFAGVAYGNGVFVALDSTVMTSNDGLSWSEGGPVGFSPLVRSLGFAEAMGGVFIAGGSDSGGEVALAISKDEGKTWTVPAGGEECGGDFNGVAGGNDTIVVVGSKSCRSTDGGDSFESTSLGMGVGVYFDGAQFVSFRGRSRFVSPDGANWEESELTVEGLPGGHQFQLGRLGVADDGTLVSIRDEWNNWYEEQDFYRSTDGITWQVLAPENFVASHPMRGIAFGYVNESACL